jgi:hypothetical protein
MADHAGASGIFDVSPAIKSEYLFVEFGRERFDPWAQFLCNEPFKNFGQCIALAEILGTGLFPTLVA